MDNIAAIILAGGKGSRIGGNKHARILAGVPLYVHVQNILLKAAIAPNRIGLSGKVGAQMPSNLSIIADDDGLAEGPLAGVLTGLRWAKQQGAAKLLVCACDMPFVRQETFAQLAHAADVANLAVAQSPKGLEPLLSCWRVASCLPLLEAAMANLAHPKTQDFMLTIQPSIVSIDAKEAFNINSDTDLARAQAIMETSPIQ